MNIEVKRVNEVIVRYYGSSRPGRERQDIQLDMYAPGIVSESEQRYREVYAGIHDFSDVDNLYYTVYLELILTLENDCHYELIDRRPMIKNDDKGAIIGAIRRNLKKNGSIRQYIVEMVEKMANGIDTCDGIVPTTSREEMEFWEGTIRQDVIGMIEKKTNDIVPTTSREEMEKFWEGK